MRVSRKLLLLFLLLLVSATLLAQAAPNPASVAAYKNALANLRMARSYMNQLGPNDHIDNQEQHAVAEMDYAMREIEASGVKDDKSINDNPAIAHDLVKSDRYVKALSLTQTAYTYIEKSPSGDAVRDSHIKDHIKAAVETIKVIQKEKH